MLLLIIITAFTIIKSNGNHQKNITNDNMYDRKQKLCEKFLLHQIGCCTDHFIWKGGRQEKWLQTTSSPLNRNACVLVFLRITINNAQSSKSRRRKWWTGT